MNPYLSRRIGLVEEEPIPITYGTRLAGQTGRYELGFIQVRTGRHRTVPTEDFTIARVKRSLFQQSSIGVIYTRRATGSSDENPAPPDRHTQGFDLDLKTSRFLGDKNLEFQAFLVWHTDPVRNDGILSFSRDFGSHGVTLGYPNDIWNGRISYSEFGADFDPAIGFVRRNGYRELSPRIEFSPRPRSIPAIRQFMFDLDIEYLTDLANRLQTRRIDLGLFGIRFESGGFLSMGAVQLFEHLEEEFTIHEDDVHGDIVIPEDDYSTLGWFLRGRSASRRPIAGDIEINSGQFWSGHRLGYELGLMLRPYPGVSLGGEVERNDVSLLEGDFATDLFRLTSEWHITPWISVTGSLQYDDVSEIMGLYAKFRWIIRPGSDLYFVYTHNWLNLDEQPLRFDLTTNSQGVASKINYTFRF